MRQRADWQILGGRFCRKFGNAYMLRDGNQYVRMLVMMGENIGLNKRFLIYDTDDRNGVLFS